jgi:hypothetical protein
MLKFINSALRCISDHGYKQIISLLILISVPRLLNAQCDNPYTDGYTAKWACSYYDIYAYPGELLTLNVIVTNDTAPCANPGDQWGTGGAGLFYMEGYGYWQQPNVYPISSDCYTQSYQIQVPFEGADNAMIYAVYLHVKAGNIRIESTIARTNARPKPWIRSIPGPAIWFLAMPII